MMIKATYNDKEKVVTILSASFDDNKSVNYLINRGETGKKESGT